MGTLPLLRVFSVKVFTSSFVGSSPNCGVHNRRTVQHACVTSSTGCSESD